MVIWYFSDFKWMKKSFEMIDDIMHTQWKLNFELFLLLSCDVWRYFRKCRISRSWNSADYSSTLAIWISIIQRVVHLTLIMPFPVLFLKNRLLWFFSRLSTLFSSLDSIFLNCSPLFLVVQSDEISFWSLWLHSTFWSVLQVLGWYRASFIIWM